MQPVAIIMPRAEAMKSAPWHMRLTMSKPVTILPVAPIFTRSRRPAPTSALCTRTRPSVNGMPTRSEYSSGAAPVPPSAPSTTMKSGVMSSSTIALQTARNSMREPAQILNPTGLPPLSSRMTPMNRTSSRGVE